MGSKKIHIFALAAHGEGISGGDRIFIEFARHWSANYPVEIFVWEEGYQMLRRQQLVNSKFEARNSKLKLQVSKMWPWKDFGFVINYLARIIEGIRIGLTLKFENPQNNIVYSASDFWMDSLPSVILKIRNPKIKWVAAWYQTAPKPWIGYTESNRGARYTFSAFFYWLVQLPIKPIIAKFANYVLVNNDMEKQQFPRHAADDKAIVVLGAVDLDRIKRFKELYAKRYPLNPKIYDAVFQGRFHPQKGVIELIDIWRIVVAQKPDAKLVMIGDGPLRRQVELRIMNYELRKNVVLTGYLFDGEEKYKIFAQSKLVLHPAFYDSGGMASFEAMAFGLPCIGFNLSSYKYYYPKGMEKVKIGDLDSFADKILQLLSNKKLYKKISQQATELINYQWSWEYRSRQILKQMLE